MKIAILGWGSLIWNPRNLEINKTQGPNGWFSDGPMLPIEFARISQDGRLTLVIVPKGEKVKTLYAISKYKVLEHAIIDLAVREGCGKSKIGFFVKSDGNFQSKSNIREYIESWINLKEEIEAVIWTDLSMNFKDKIGIDFNEENAINYLKYLPLEIKVKAEQYIRRAPSAVITPIRVAIENELGWTRINLPNKE